MPPQPDDLSELRTGHHYPQEFYKTRSLSFSGNLNNRTFDKVSLDYKTSIMKPQYHKSTYSWITIYLLSSTSRFQVLK